MDNAAPDIIEFVTDPQLLGLTVSPAQETLLRGIYGLPLPSADHLDLWRQCTGRETYPAQPFGEITVIAGARAGKDSQSCSTRRSSGGTRLTWPGASGP
jgi:hypothetical protein